MGTTLDPDAAALVAASEGFDFLFSNRLAEAQAHFAAEKTPFHLLGLGICAFLEAVLGMEVSLAIATACCGT